MTPRMILAALAATAALAAPLAATLGWTSPILAMWIAAAAALAAATLAAATLAAGAASQARFQEAAPAPATAEAAPDAAAPAEAFADDAAADIATTALGRLARGETAWRAPGAGPATGAANAALAAAQSGLDEAIALAELMAAGDLSVEGSRGHPGAYGALIARLNAVGAGLRDVFAAVRGAAEDMATRSEALSGAASDLSARIHVQVEALDSARDAGDALAAAVGEVDSAAAEGGRRSADAVSAIGRVTDNSRRITEVLDAIAGVARQTKLLGVNAAVEAARVGDAGRGFAVVASEIQSLAGQAGAAATRIEGFLRESDAASAEAGREVGAVAETLARIEAETAGVAGAVGAIRAACAAQTEALDAAVSQIGAADDAAREGETTAAQTAQTAEGLDRAAEALRDRLAGVVLRDEGMTDAARAAAEAVSRRFEEGVRAGRITLDALFSRDYRPVAGTNPQQYDTDFNAFTDEAATPVIEDLLALGDHVLFACVINRDGFLPTHNRKFSKPQGADPVWNTAHSRNRRFFDDRVGLAAGRSEAATLIQAYRRDMGGGAHVVMKDVSAPIRVQGRRWGGLRIGYRPQARPRAQGRAAA